MRTVSKTRLTNQSLSFAKLVSFRDKTGSAEAASLLPNVSASLPCAEFVAGLRRWHWWSGKLLHSPEALVGFQGRGCTDVVQPNCCHPFLLEALLFQWPSIRRCASRTMGEHKTPESRKSVQGSPYDADSAA